MNTKFILRGLVLALPVAVFATAAGLALMVRQARLGLPTDRTLSPLTILAPWGEPPAGPVGLEEWPEYRGEPYGLAGSGFLILLGDGEVMGVTTAHSVSLDNPDQPLERIALRVAGQTDFVAEFDTLRG